MAQSPRAGKRNQPKRPKLSGAEKKEARKARRQRRRDTLSQMRQAFSMTRQYDNKLVPFMALAFIAAAFVGFFLLWLPTGSVFVAVLPALMLGILAAMFTFSRRAQTSMYAQAEGQPGAAAYVLGQLRGDWYKSDAVAGTAQFDAVHRVLGRPGVVLIGEGAPSRVKPLLAQEKKRVSKLAGDAPIYDIIVGRGEGEIPLGKLNVHIMKLPRNLSKEQVVALERRLAALSSARMPLPQGPMPGGAKMRNIQRAARRRG
jgi:hypothetical protein